MADTMELGSVEEAKAFAQNKGRPFLVLSRETLDQIEATEAAGGFEGGMSDEDRLPPPASAGRVCAAGGRTRCHLPTRCGATTPFVTRRTMPRPALRDHARRGGVVALPPPHPCLKGWGVQAGTAAPARNQRKP
jgi:hypothetical protein